MGRIQELNSYQEQYVGKDKFFEKLLNKLKGEHWEITEEILFTQTIERRIWIFLEQCASFIIEDSYTETEWKDIVSVHYIHTSYNVDSTVLRVHFFNEKINIDESYLGFVTIRKIDFSKIVLSQIYPNWNVLELDGDFIGGQIVTATKEVHIFFETVNIETTPFFAQDGTVTCCAQANIIMLSQFLQMRFGYKKISIKTIEEEYSRYDKRYPTKGMTPIQIMEVLTNNNINMQQYYLKNDAEEDILNEVLETIKAHLGSGFPVIMGIESHAVMIIGYRALDEDNDIELIFFDDSGALIHSITHKEGELQYSNFIYKFSWQYIKKYLKSGTSNVVQFLVPSHEKVYVNYSHVASRFNILEKIVESKQSDLNNSMLKNKKIFFEVNTLCKSFVNEWGCIEKDVVDEFVTKNLPHYLWCVQFEDEYGRYILFADTTYNMLKEENDIFINCNQIPFVIEKDFMNMFHIKTNHLIKLETGFLVEERIIKSKPDGKLESYTSRKPKREKEEHVTFPKNLDDKEVKNLDDKKK